MTAKSLAAQAQRLQLSGAGLRVSFRLGLLDSIPDIGRVTSFEAGCVVDDDPGEVVRGARPTTVEDRNRMREQNIARLLAEHLADAPARAAARPVQDRVRVAMADWRVRHLSESFSAR